VGRKIQSRERSDRVALKYEQLTGQCGSTNAERLAVASGCQHSMM
jgi:hypothetical protein